MKFGSKVATIVWHDEEGYWLLLVKDRVVSYSKDKNKLREMAQGGNYIVEEL